MSHLKAVPGLVGALVALTSWISPQSSFALSCVRFPLLSNLDTPYPLVVGSIVQSDSEGALTVSITDTLHGVAKQNPIRVDAHRLMFWHSESASFPENSRWVFRLYPPERAGSDYQISACAMPPSVSENLATGWLTQIDRRETLAISDLKVRIADPFLKFLRGSDEYFVQE